MRLKQWIAPAFAATMMLVPHAYAQSSTWTIDPNHSRADFQVRHLALSTVRGSISGVKGTLLLDEKDIAKSKVEATLSTATVNTGNEGRDADLKSPNFFDVEKNPTITFKSTAITKANGKLQIVGDLTLNGLTKSVTLDVDSPAPPQKGQNKIVSDFSASGMLKRADFNFAQSPKYSAVIGDNVKFTINVEVDKQ